MYQTKRLFSKTAVMCYLYIYNIQEMCLCIQIEQERVMYEQMLDEKCLELRAIKNQVRLISQ